VEAVQCDGSAAAGKANAVGDLGDGADLRVLVLVLGDEQDAVLGTDVDGEGDVHVGEDDDVLQRDEQKACRVLGLAHDALFRTDAIVGSETVPTTAKARSDRLFSLRYAANVAA
jgi:hypothetical protein